MKTKECSSCHKELPMSSFGKNGTTPAGTKKFKAKCHQCSAAYASEIFYQKVTQAVGGEENMKCAICEYNNCLAALEFHHIDASQKERPISWMQNYSYGRIKKEVDKCILLCCLCHREVHAGVTELPN